LTRKAKLLLFSLIVLGWLSFSVPDYANATGDGSQEQVVVSPAQQAVNSALGTATTEVQQAINATENSATEITQAQTELSQAQAAVSGLSSAVSTAQTSVNNVQSAINNINGVDLTVTPVDQSSQLVQDAKATVINAQTAINNINTTTAQTEISQTTTARSEAVTAQATAQTELTQANIAIDAAQTAVNNLQSTIGTTVNVLAGVDDAGVQMNLPFGMQMGGTVYNNVFVGSNATITFGSNEGNVYWDTPGAPSISIAGWDWTTWSTGTGITYSTTGTSLDVAWDLRPYPQQDASTQMVQIRFNADVNPNDGAWMANVTAVGPIPGGARFNYRETTNGAITPITDTNTGTGFAGQISQGSTFTPYVNPNTSAVQAAVDAANATITQLNQSLSPVVAQNALNNSAINAINTTSLTNTVNSAISTKNALQTTLNTRSSQLTTAINNNIPTPAPIIGEAEINGTSISIPVSMPEGYSAGTWYYQVELVGVSASNPYVVGTSIATGSSELIELEGLTEGATYTISIANSSGAVSAYTSTTVSIPASQSSNLTGGGISEPPAEEPPAEEPPAEEPPAEEPPAEEPPAEEPPAEEPPAEEPPAEEPPAEEPPAEEPPAEEPPAEEPPAEEPPAEEMSVEEIVEVVENLIADGNLTASDAEAVLESLSADGEITSEEVNNLSDALTEDGTFTLAEKELVADALVESSEGAPIAAADIAAAGLEYRDLPPQIPVEVREDANGNPVVITAEVASALLTLESPAALVNAIAGCFNPEEAIEGLTEEQKCELDKALANIGADMSPEERQDAKEILVAAILVGQVILGSSILRIRG